MVRIKHCALVAAFVALVMACMPQQVSAAAKEKSYGMEMGYVTKNKSLEFGLFFQYSFSDHFRVVPQADCIFRRNNLDAFVFDLDAHVPFDFSGNKVGLYPIAGFNFSSWHQHADKDNDITSDDVSTRRSRFGVNVGAGADYKITDNLKLNLELKFTMIKRYSTATIQIGAAYLF